MGTFNLTINYPDAQQARILGALKANWTTKDAQGNNVVPTTSQVIEYLRLSVAANIKNIVLRHERDLAVAAAYEGVTEIGAT